MMKNTKTIAKKLGQFTNIRLNNTQFSKITILSSEQNF